METVTVSQAKASLSRLVQRALEGEVISIGRRGHPEVVLMAVSRDPSPRSLGSVTTDELGRPVHVADDFDDPVPGFAESLAGDPSPS